MPIWIKLALYIAPFAIAFSALTGFLVYTGETMPLNMVIAHQQGEEPVLFRYRYGNRDQQYKLQFVNTKKAEVLAIGSSRILQFREGFFNKNPDAFYNAAAPAWTLNEVNNLLENIDPSVLPKVLIFALDPIWFNDNYVGDVFPEPLNDFSNIFVVNRSFMQDVIKGETFDIGFYLKRIEPGTGTEMALGLRAIRDGHGFRNDGSEQFGDYLVAHWVSQEQQRDHHLNMMREGKEVYPFGDSVSQDKLDLLRSTLDIAKAKNIYVIGFLPSYMPTLWEEMIQNENHAYIPKVTESLQSIFAEYNYALYDYSNGASLGIKDTDFFDGWHASELGNLLLYLDLLAKEPILQTYSEASGLYEIVAKATSTWAVFAN